MSDRKYGDHIAQEDDDFDIRNAVIHGSCPKAMLLSPDMAQKVRDGNVSVMICETCGRTVPLMQWRWHFTGEPVTRLVM